jgi:hypothetical protein
MKLNISEIFHHWTAPEANSEGTKAPFLSEDRRLVTRVLAYWDTLRDARAFPGASDIDPAAIEDDWAMCFLVTVGSHPGRCVFRRIGEDLRIPGWDEADGHTVMECPENTLLRKAASYMPKVLEKRVPVSVGGEFEDGDFKVLYRSILLPLSDDGVQVNCMLGAVNCRREAKGAGIGRKDGEA